MFFPKLTPIKIIPLILQTQHVDVVFCYLGKRITHAIKGLNKNAGFRDKEAFHSAF